MFCCVQWCLWYQIFNIGACPVLAERRRNMVFENLLSLVLTLSKIFFNHLHMKSFVLWVSFSQLLKTCLLVRNLFSNKNAYITRVNVNNCLNDTQNTNLLCFECHLAEVWGKCHLCWCHIRLNMGFCVAEVAPYQSGFIWQYVIGVF